jgi:hypothetical protein
MSKIIRFDDWVDIGLNRRDIFGLDILSVNNAENQLNEDLFILFFRELTTRFNCSAHFGNLHDMADDPEKLFGSPNGVNPYKMVRTGIYGGTFYDADKWANFPPCYFPMVKESFWKSQRKDSEDMVNFKEIVKWDALALYLEPKYDSHSQMGDLAQRPFSSDEGWTQAVSALYKLVVVTRFDGRILQVYAENATNLELLNPALETVVAEVEALDWYRQNKDRFEWEPNRNLCLTLPENRRA